MCFISLRLADKYSLCCEKGRRMPFFRTYFHRMGTTNVYRLAKILWSVDLRPISDRLTKDYLVIGGSRDTMACRAGIGRHLFLLKTRVPFPRVR